MNQEIIHYNTNLNSLENKGKHIYSSNIHYKNLATIMEHPEFKNFYNTYLKDFENTRTMLMFMKIYDSIGKHFPNLNPFQKIYILKDIIDNSETRKKICGMMSISDFSSEKMSRNYIE
jgi:hypothetical protein